MATRAAWSARAWELGGRCAVLPSEGQRRVAEVVDREVGTTGCLAGWPVKGTGLLRTPVLPERSWLVKAVVEAG